MVHASGLTCVLHSFNPSVIYKEQKFSSQCLSRTHPNTKLDMFTSRVTIATIALISSAVAKMAMNGECSMLMRGNGPLPLEDTPKAFQALKNISDSATSAVTPSGYISSYVNTNATYNEPKLFAGYTDLDTYDVQRCKCLHLVPRCLAPPTLKPSTYKFKSGADICDSVPSCNAFTTYFERSPTMYPGPRCPNPPSSTKIKCAMWRGTITSDMPMNSGQYQQDFLVVIAGSNAYVKDVLDLGVVPKVAGYTTEVYEHGAAIQTPLDCHGKDTYLGVREWFDGKYSAQRCIDACSAMPDCHFANTYFERKDDVPFSQHCALFSARWPASYATNSGQYQGDEVHHMNATYSYG
jgi:hypothetical protein